VRGGGWTSDGPPRAMRHLPPAPASAPTTSPTTTPHTHARMRIPTPRRPRGTADGADSIRCLPPEPARAGWTALCYGDRGAKDSIVPLEAAGSPAPVAALLPRRFRG
jgi:hypothetical protein